VEETFTTLPLGFSASSQAAEKVRDGDNQMPSWAEHIFPGQGLGTEVILLYAFPRSELLMTFLVSLQSPVYLSTSDDASSALLRILANSGREMWPPHVGSN